jgi:hypothetical protein
MAAPSHIPQDVARIPDKRVEWSSNRIQNLPQAVVQAGALTSGSCGYKDPTTGIACGCRSYWMAGGLNLDSAQFLDFCACTHHACFHNLNTPSDPNAAAGTNEGTIRNLSGEVMQHLRELGALLATIPSKEAHQGSHLPLNDRLQTIPPAEFTGLDNSDGLVLPSTEDGVYLPSFSNLLAGLDPINQDLQEQQNLNNTNDGTGLGVTLPEYSRADPSRADPGAFNSDHRGSPALLSQFHAASFARLFQALNPGTLDANMPSTIADSPLNQNGGEMRFIQESSKRPGFYPATHSQNASPSGVQDSVLLSATDLITPSLGCSTPDRNSIPPSVIRPARESVALGVKGSKSGGLPLTRRVGQSSVSHQREREGPSQVLLLSSQAATPPPPVPQDPSSLREMAHHLSALRAFVLRHGSLLRGISDRLENVELGPSYSQPPKDQELCDKVEGIETRIMEIESHVDHHGKLLDEGEHSDDGSKTRRYAHGDAKEHVLAPADGPEELVALRDRVEHIEERMAEIERHLPPSSSRPSTVEVVFLPWGRDLRGLWVQPEGPKTPSSRLTSQDREDWINSQDIPSAVRTASSLRAGSDSGWSNRAIEDWANNSNEWLVPRACGAKSVVYHRLKSRGFVQEVKLNKPGAKEILDAISEPFSELLDVVVSNGNDDELCQQDETESLPLLGLGAQLIPLRKVAGVSKLRFLSKSEMVTPALWTYEFLMSSVIMRTAGGPKRLFVTHKEAYLQPSSEVYSSWTWEMIQKLKTPDTILDFDNRTWKKHSILDAPPISLNSSFGSHQSATPPPSATSEKPSAINPNTRQFAPHIAASVSHMDSEEAYSKARGPITPITNPRDVTTQDWVEEILRSPSNSEDSQSDQEYSDSHVAPSESNKASSEEPTRENHERYNLRRISRTASTPIKPRPTNQASNPRSFSAATTTAPSKRPRSFERITNPLIDQIPNVIPSPKRPTAKKRRRLSYDPPPLRRQRSSSSSFAQMRNIGKRAVTPSAAYATPHSGQFGEAQSPVVALESEVGEWDGPAEEEHRESDDEEAWEGVGDDGDEAHGQPMKSEVVLTGVHDTFNEVNLRQDKT